MSLKVTAKNLRQGLLFIVIVGIILVVSLGDLEFTIDKALVTIGFMIIALISFMSIVADTRIISMNKFHWYFQLVFMGLAPMCQYISDYYPWSVKVSQGDMLAAQAIVLIFDFLYIIFYSRKSRYVTNLNISGHLGNYLTVEREFSGIFPVVCLIVGVAGFVILVSMIGFYDLFFRAENSLDIENSTINFIIRKFLTSLPAMLSAALILWDKKKPLLLNKVCIIILLFFTICANFPTSTTRYWMGTIYLGLVVLMFFKRKESRILDYAILIVLLVGFPILYSFKSYSTDITTILQTGIEYKGILESFNSVDFDAFTLVARAVRYVRENGITWGQQLLNIVLFFIPRSIWTSKPITTNVLIAESIGQNFTNLSCPLPAEGYVNFGIVGVVLYVIVYARFSRWIDNLYWNCSEDGKINVINMGYPFLCVILLYIERGPLQPAFIQTVALFIPLVMVNWISKKVINDVDIKGSEL